MTNYSWIIHELTHSLFHHHQEHVFSVILQRLNPHVQNLRLACVADRGHVKAIKRAQFDQIAKLWSPTVDQSNWSHELVADVVAIATAGHAYAKSFLADTSQIRSPFELTQSHPPFALRCQAMRESANTLGWKKLALQLDDRQELWSEANKFDGPDNSYRAAADAALMRACIDSAFQIMKELDLPRCRPQQSTTARQKVLANQMPDLGIELILGAWHAAATFSPSELQAWTQRIVAQALKANR